MSINPSVIISIYYKSCQPILGRDMWKRALINYSAMIVP